MIVKILQKGFNFSQDGPGNRLVYHLQGCTMRCPWCSNPESIALNGSVIAKDSSADALCPFGNVKDGFPDAAKCNTCTRPCLNTNNRSLRLSYTEACVEDIISEVRKSSMMFFDGGGVTFTGGEATVQFEALKHLLCELHSMGINTALETNGSHPSLPELFDSVDYLIIDLKHHDPEKHKDTVGMSNEITVKNILKAVEKRNQLLVRIPLIGGFNSSRNDAEAFAELLSPLKDKGLSLEVLRYHEYGKDKWYQCGMEYTVKDAFVSDDDFKLFCKILSDSGITLVRT